MAEKTSLVLSPHKISNKVASFTDNLFLKLFGIALNYFITIPISQVKLYFGKLGFTLLCISYNDLLKGTLCCTSILML